MDVNLLYDGLIKIVWLALFFQVDVLMQFSKGGGGGGIIGWDLCIKFLFSKFGSLYMKRLDLWKKKRKTNKNRISERRIICLPGRTPVKVICACLSRVHWVQRLQWSGWIWSVKHVMKWGVTWAGTGAEWPPWKSVQTRMLCWPCSNRPSSTMLRYELQCFSLSQPSWTCLGMNIHGSMSVGHHEQHSGSAS